MHNHSSVVYPYGLDALMMETLACRDKMLFANEKAVTKLELETDSQRWLDFGQEGTIQDLVSHQ